MIPFWKVQPQCPHCESLNTSPLGARKDLAMMVTATVLAAVAGFCIWPISVLTVLIWSAPRGQIFRCGSCGQTFPVQLPGLRWGVWFSIALIIVLGVVQLTTFQYQPAARR
jgi:hypothetical protein